MPIEKEFAYQVTLTPYRGHFDYIKYFLMAALPEWLYV